METIDIFLPNFTSILKDNTSNKNCYNLGLIEESTKISNNPFLSLLIAYFLKNDINIILLSERESLNHYSTIGRKFGINLCNLDNFCYVDFQNSYISMLNIELPLSENYPNTFNILHAKNQIDMKKNNIFNNENLKFDYDKFIPLLKEKVNKFKENKNKIVIIEDKTNDDINQLNKLLKFSYENNISLIFSINKEINEQSTIDYIRYLSDIIIEFKQNESGFSKDVDGMMNININKDKLNNDINGDKISQIRYSLQSNNIKFFTHLKL
jgi:hypothetical protein